MKLQFKNKHIFFALGDIWEMLNYKLKFQINEIVTVNEDLETLQDVEFSRNDLELIISSVNNRPQGIAREINPEMFMAIHGGTKNVGIGTLTPNASAILDLESTTKGLSIPTMTSAQASAIATPKKSLMLYVTDTNGTFTSAGWWGYNGTIWKLILAE